MTEKQEAQKDLVLFFKNLVNQKGVLSKENIRSKPTRPYKERYRKMLRMMPKPKHI